MINRKYIYIFFYVIIVIVFSACSDYQKLLKSGDVDMKLEKAIEYYEEDSYHKAQTLLSDIRSYYRGTEKAETINYYNAYCHYGMGEMSVAAYLFKDFANTFPNSDKREEAEYMAAYCYFLLSPPTSLDQAFTQRAMQELELFIDRYPESQKRDTVNNFIDKLQQKLELKAYDNAHLYYKIGYYRAAVTSLKNVLIDYPDTKYREDVLYFIVKANYEYADNSVIDKQNERHNDVVKAYYDFVDNFPKSDKIKEIEKLYNNSIKYIKENDGL